MLFTIAFAAVSVVAVLALAIAVGASFKAADAEDKLERLLAERYTLL